MNRLIKSQRVRLEAAPEPALPKGGHGECQPSARLIPVDAHSALVEVTCSCGEQLTLELALDAGPSNPGASNLGNKNPAASRAQAPPAAAPHSQPSPTGAPSPEAQ